MWRYFIIFAKHFKKTDMNKKYIYLSLVLTCVIVIIGIAYYYVFSSFSTQSETAYIYIDDDDNVDSVYTKLTPIGCKRTIASFTTMVQHTSYAENIHTGRYAVEPGQSTYSVFKTLKNGLQSPVKVTIPSVRTMDKLAATVSKKLYLDSLSLIQALTDNATCQQYGYDTATIYCLFIPNTYEIYWDTTVEKFLKRMKKEHDRFWNDNRKAQAKNIGLTIPEVVTIASIVAEETNNTEEKPTIAGVYINRIKIDMPLQSCPTVKFAMKRFDLRRIYNSMLNYDSPYNTYRYGGLPPGPIRIPQIEDIEAVLNYVHHDYLYMCAKEDFSGTHNFAATFAEHKANSVRYDKALNERGIK